jgi:MGT family glycosyltransferase
MPWEQDHPLVHAVQPSPFDGSDDPRGPSWIDQLDRSRPLVYATLGTIFTDFPRVWKALLAAFGELEADVLLTTGTAIDLGPLPPNVHARSYVPQSQVLPRCSAVVCHAGFNKLIGAFRHGLPAVCIPVAADQPLNASAGVRAGAGISLANSPGDARGPIVDPDTLEAGEIVGAVRRVLEEPSFAERSAQLAAEIEAMASPEETASLLGRLASASTAARRR